MSRIILKSGAIVLLGTLLYKIAFLAKDIILTSKLGISHELTLFVTAFLIPSFLCNTLAQSLQVSSSHYIVEHNKTVSKNFLYHIFKKVSVTAIISYVLLVAFLPYIFTSYTDEEILHLRSITLLSLPFYILMPIRGILGQNLYLNHRYLLNFSLAMISAFTLIIYSLAADQPSSTGLMISLSFGSLLEVIAVYLAASRIGSISKERSGKSLKIKVIFSGFFLQLLLMAPPLIDQIFAHVKGSNYLTIYNYAIKIPNILTTLSMIMASSVLLPYFIENKGNSTAHKISKNKLIISILGLAIFYILAPMLSQIVVNLVYQRGKFTSEDALSVSHIQSIYFYSAPLTAIFMVYIRYLNAHEKHRQATQTAGTVVLCSFLFCYLCLKINRLDLIPFSIMGSYLVTVITFKLRQNK